MKDIMLAELPVEQRAQILKDSCDKIRKIAPDIAILEV